MEGCYLSDKRGSRLACHNASDLHPSTSMSSTSLTGRIHNLQSSAKFWRNGEGKGEPSGCITPFTSWHVKSLARGSAECFCACQGAWGRGRVRRHGNVWGEGDGQSGPCWGVGVGGGRGGGLAAAQCVPTANPGRAPDVLEAEVQEALQRDGGPPAAGAWGQCARRHRPEIGGSIIGGGGGE